MINDPSAASPTCRTTGYDWERGWMVFANPACDNDPSGVNAEILQIHNGVASGGPGIFPSSSGANARQIRFNPLGTILLGEAKGFAIQAQGSNTIQSNICVARTGRTTRNAQTPPDTCIQ
jgi:type IV fimbrial biogenesis protein FimT